MDEWKLVPTLLQNLLTDYNLGYEAPTTKHCSELTPYFKLGLYTAGVVSVIQALVEVCVLACIHRSHVRCVTDLMSHRTG